MTNEELFVKLSDIIDKTHTVGAFSTGDWIAIILALISAGVTIYMGLSTNRINKQMNDDNINANLKAKARIEWIQNVRSTSSEMIGLYYAAINANDCNEMLEKIIAARQKLEQLILYFGPESKEKNLTHDIFDETTNDGKNDLIVKWLNNYANDFVRYYNNRNSGIYTMIENRVNNATININKCDIKPETYDELIREYEEASDDLKKAQVLYTLLYHKLTWIRDMMRIYLKIEWNKAKQGK